jgi:hypothetical protein
MDPGVRRDDVMERVRAWIPAFAGMTVTGVRRDDGQ